MRSMVDGAPDSSLLLRRRSVVQSRAPSPLSRGRKKEESLAMKHADQKQNEDFAVLSAMLKAGLRTKPKLRAIDYAKRFAREKLAQARRYLRRVRAVAHLPAQGLPAAPRLRRRGERLPAPRARPRAASGAVARPAGHPRRDAAQYRRAGACGAAMHAPRPLCVVDPLRPCPSGKGRVAQSAIRCGLGAAYFCRAFS
jgi:hypothetical protein